MESATATPHHQGPATPSHPALLPSLSPSATHSEQTPAPPHAYGGYLPTSAPGQSQGPSQSQTSNHNASQSQGSAPLTYHPPPPPPHSHSPAQHPGMMYVPHTQHAYHTQHLPPGYPQHPHAHPQPHHQGLASAGSHSHMHSMGPPGGSNGMPPPHYQPQPQAQSAPVQSTQQHSLSVGQSQQQQQQQPGQGKPNAAQTPVRKQSGASQTPRNGEASTPLGNRGQQTPTLASAVPMQEGASGQGSQAGVFGAVMQPPAGSAKVYASVYSGIPVFEAMIRGISVMRRTSDSWVNATQILKVAGIPKSARTKILEKEILAGVHEKVQGGYGKYQGTWIPLERGHELAGQYGVTNFLSPIFDFVPSPANVAALPVAKGDGGKAAAAAHMAGLETPDRPQKTPGAVMNYSALGSINNGRTPTPASRVYAPSSAHGHSQSPMPHSLSHPPHEMPLQPPPSFLSGEGMMMPPHPAYGGMYYAPPGQPASAMPTRTQPLGPHGSAELVPAAELNGYGLPPSQSDMYVDAYGQPHSAHFSMPMAPEGSNGLREGASEPPMKRFKSEVYDDVEGASVAEEEQNGGSGDTGDDSDSDEPSLRNAPPVPSAMRLSTKPIRPKAGTAGKARNKLMALFHEDVQDVRAYFGLPRAEEKMAAANAKAEDEGAEDVTMEEAAGPSGTAKIEAEDDTNSQTGELDFDIDAIIDDQGHTALHWAASLARMHLVEQLIELGADINRGNYAGETPLIRAVLTTNHVESGTFTALLGHLSDSTRTIDHAYRTVVHHIALVAGVKGRAAAARSYMAAILGWVAKGMKGGQIQNHSQAFARSGNAAAVSAGVNGSANGHVAGANGESTAALPPLALKTLVDVQDVHGDTALNVAARVGNTGLVKSLLDAGADKARANKLGLKPVDFGLEVESLSVSTGEAVVSDLKAEVSRPVRQSRDVQKNIATIFESINETFNTEMMAKQSKLNTTEQNVRTATRALAEKRQAVTRAQAALGEAQIVQQKVDNLRRALSDPDELTWTDMSASPTRAKTSPSNGTAGSLALPEQGSEGAVLRLRRMLAWEDQMASALVARTAAVRSRGAEDAVKYRKLVSLCTRTPVEGVDSMLDSLVAAVEADGNALDLGRIGEYMKKGTGGQGRIPIGQGRPSFQT